MFSSRFLVICGCNIFKSLSGLRCSASSAAIRGPCPEELSSWNQGHGLCVSKTLTPVHLAKCVCVHLEAQWALKMSVNYMMSTALQSFFYSYFETLNCKIHFVWKRVRRAGLPGKGRPGWVLCCCLLRPGCVQGRSKFSSLLVAKRQRGKRKIHKHEFKLKNSVLWHLAAG